METGEFGTKFLRNFPTEPIICVKEDLLRKSPNSLKRTFLNANIHRQSPNLKKCSRGNLL